MGVCQNPSWCLVVRGLRPSRIFDARLEGGQSERLSRCVSDRFANGTVLYFEQYNSIHPHLDVLVRCKLEKI